MRRRHALVADLIIRELSSDQPAHHLEGVVRARNRLEDVGFNAPSWEALGDGVRPEVNSLDDAGPGMPQHGWQFKATQNVDDFFISTSICPRLPDASKDLFRSQSGPLSGLPFTCCPTAFHSRFDAQVFRVLLLRRLWLPLPPSSRTEQTSAGWKSSRMGCHCSTGPRQQSTRLSFLSCAGMERLILDVRTRVEPHWLRPDAAKNSGTLNWQDSTAVPSW